MNLSTRPNTASAARAADRLALPLTDRLSFLWLAIAAGLLVFANGMMIVPLATWIAPIFMVRFLRSQRALPGLLLGYVVNAAAFMVGWRPAFVDAGAMFGVYSIFFALLCFLPYAIDRLLAPRFRGYTGALVLPIAWTAVEYLLHLVSPLGTFFLLPYTQGGNLPLLQVMALTGMWGVTFLITWLAGTINYAWERGFVVERAGRGMAAYAVVLAAVLIGGGLRLAVFPPEGATVQVAALTTNVNREVLPEPDTPRDQRLLAGALTDDDVQAMTATMNAINEDLLQRTSIQADAGARIVTWTEYNAHTWKGTEQAFLDTARSLAREKGIYLAFPLAVIQPDVAQRPAPHLVVENKSVMITPEGEVAYTYLKHNLLIGWESEHAVRGERVIHAIDTPYGRLASVICLDMEYPDFMRLAGQQGVDIMLSGAIDGTPSTHGNPIHSTMASFRTIEEGFSLARGGFYGANVAVDYQGRLLGRTGHYTASDRTVVAHLPIKGVRTPYNVLGDYFPVTCLALLVAATLFALVSHVAHVSPVTRGEAAKA